ncbi:hypothetical protein C8R46DRAFT_1092728 [Mycena filopes]|nr:hypothetical protein C8R46DRAFT_1092728 [Mycena filopes]
MQELPAPVSSPPYTPPSTKQLEPICFITTNLHGYLSEDAASKSVLNHALYLPKRLWHMFGFQYVAYGPTHRYDRIAGNWTEGSDLTSFHGGTRELFVDAKEFMVYIGTYRCHDLGPLEPNGTSLPSHISLPEIMDAALGVPWPPGHATIMKQRYPDGVRVSATGLQCVGFNMQLYDALRKRFAHERNKVNADGRKRKAEEEDAPLGGKGKSQKRS